MHVVVGRRRRVRDSWIVGRERKQIPVEGWLDSACQFYFKPKCIWLDFYTKAQIFRLHWMML